MTIKASARHNKQDRQLLRDSLKKANELTNLLSQLGAIEDAEDENENDPEDAVVIEEKNDNGVISPGATVVTGSEKKSVEDDTMTVKAISLDETISNIRDAFYKQFRTGYLYSSDSSDYPYILSVYSDFVVCKCGMNYYKVPYTIGDDKIVFEVRASWVSVEPDWVTKSISHFDDVLKSVKAVGEDRLGMYLVMWGDEKNRDLGKEFFTAKTRGMLDVFKAVGKIPTFYHHGLDSNAKAEVVGMYDVMVEDDVGIWAETQLEKASKYKTAMLMMAEKGALGSSSGCLPASRKVNKKSGEIEGWTIIEGSLTPTPMDYRQRLDMPVEVLKSVYSTAGLDFPFEELQEPSQGDEESQKTTDNTQLVELELMQMSLELTKTQLELGVI